MEDGAAQGARTDANSAGSSKRPDTRIQIPSPTSLARLPLLRFASNAGKAIDHTGQEFSHLIKPVQMKKATLPYHMSINEQSLGRSPPEMRATDRGVKWAVCVSMYDSRCIHSTPPRSLRTAVIFPHALPLAFALGWEVLRSKVPLFFRRNRDWWAARGGGHRSVVVLHAWLAAGVAGGVGVGVWVVVLPCTGAVAVVAWSAATAAISVSSRCEPWSCAASPQQQLNQWMDVMSM